MGSKILSCIRGGVNPTSFYFKDVVYWVRICYNYIKFIRKVLLMDVGTIVVSKSGWVYLIIKVVYKRGYDAEGKITDTNEYILISAKNIPFSNLRSNVENECAVLTVQGAPVMYNGREYGRIIEVNGHRAVVMGYKYETINGSVQETPVAYDLISKTCVDLVDVEPKIENWMKDLCGMLLDTLNQDFYLWSIGRKYRILPTGTSVQCIKERMTDEFTFTVSYGMVKRGCYVGVIQDLARVIEVLGNPLVAVHRLDEVSQILRKSAELNKVSLDVTFVVSIDTKCHRVWCISRIEIGEICMEDTL